MAFTLNLEIRGLCAFVPSEDLPLIPDSFPVPLPRMRVLIQEASGGEVLGFTVCPHQPQLEVEKPDGPEEDKMLAVPLTGHRIAIGTGALPADQQGLSLTQSFWKVAQMEQVNPFFNLSTDFLDDPPTQGGLVASLRLLAGTVSGINLSPLPLTFPSGYTDNFSRGVRVEIPIAGDSGTFTMTPFAGGPDQVVTFSPRPNRTSVDAILRNACEEAIAVDANLNLDPNLASNPDFAPNLDPQPAEPSLDNDFVMYYLLDPGYNGPYDFPVEKKDQRKGEVRAEAIDGGLSCIPIRTNSKPGV